MQINPRKAVANGLNYPNRILKNMNSAYVDTKTF